MGAAKDYDKAVREMSAAEARHRAALDALDQALEKRESHKVLGLRRAASETERALAEAVERAQAAHRAYWLGRAEALVPNLRQAANLMRRFNRIHAVAGSARPDAAAVVIAETLSDPAAVGVADDLIDDVAVPLEAPVSELLIDYQGSWRASSG